MTAALERVLRMEGAAHAKAEQLGLCGSIDTERENGWGPNGEGLHCESMEL